MRQQQFEYAHLFGAVCPAIGATEALIVPFLSKDVMKKHLGQEICRDIRVFFSASEIKGFVEQVVGNRIQIRIHYNGGSSVTNYREQGIYWDDYTNWRACRF